MFVYTNLGTGVIQAHLSFYLMLLLHCSCDCEKKVDGLCKTDASMGDLKTRYYDITVTASDSAGNIGSDTCQVIIVPSCNPETDSDCAAYDRPDLPNVEDFYYTRSAVDASVTQSQVLNQVSQQKLVWESGLATLDPDVMVEEAVDVDVDPPVVECDFIPNVNSINKVEDNTLYHFMSKADGDGNRLEDARFFYNLTVSAETDCVEYGLQRRLSNSTLAFVLIGKL